MNVPGIFPWEEIYRAALTASRLFSSSIDCPLEETFSRLSTLLVEELGARLVTIGRRNRVHFTFAASGSTPMSLPSSVRRFFWPDSREVGLWGRGSSLPRISISGFAWEAV